MNVRQQVGGFSDDAKLAVMKAPGYFVTWYTIKSIALCAAIAVIAYMAGRSSRR